MNGSLTVQVWSDPLCPWCWVAERRLDKALAEFPNRDKVSIVLRSFRLMPGTPVHTVGELFARKGLSEAETRARFDQMEQIAATEGLTYHLASTDLAGDTMDILRLIKFAGTKRIESKFVERLYRAYLSEHASLFERETLLRLSDEVGLDGSGAEAVLDSRAFQEEVERDEEDARNVGVRGVPYYLFAEGVALAGDQPVERYLSALRQAWNHAQENTSVPVGATCGPDGCELPS
jgi:predicted DsbA family dithiol-disulfide isomerase